MECIILAGGLGTRLKKSLPHLPKPLAPIGEKPFIQILLQQISNSKKIEKVIFSLGYKARDIQEFITSKKWPFSYVFSKEENPQGTGGAVMLALGHVEKKEVLILNGDSFCDISLDEVITYHREKKSEITMVGTNMEKSNRYGSIQVDANNRITNFIEKCTNDMPGLINAGIYCVKKGLLLRQNPPKVCSLELDIFPQLLSRKFFSFPTDSLFIDIGTDQSYTHAKKVLQFYG